MEDPAVEKPLLRLVKAYSDSQIDGRDKCEGMWLTLSKPTYKDNLGPNQEGDPQYTLGRMAFDMFRPTQLVCSIQGNFNQVKRILRGGVLAPKSLQEEVTEGLESLQTYKCVSFQ